MAKAKHCFRTGQVCDFVGHFQFHGYIDKHANPDHEDRDWGAVRLMLPGDVFPASIHSHEDCYWVWLDEVDEGDDDGGGPRAAEATRHRKS